MKVYSAVHNHGQPLGRPIRAVNRKPDAKCKIQTRVQQLLIAKPDIRLESRF